MKKYIARLATVVVLVFLTQFIVGSDLANFNIAAYAWMYGMLILGFVKVGDGIVYLMTYPFEGKKDGSQTDNRT